MTYAQGPLFTIAYILALVLAVTLIAPAKEIRLIRFMTLAVSIVALFLGLSACLQFNRGVTGFQFLHTLNVIEHYNLSFALGADGLSMIFLLLTVLIFPVLFLAT